MRKSQLMKQIAEQQGYEVIELRLPESLPFTDTAGFPRIDVKSLIEQGRRRAAQEALLSPFEDS